MLRYPRLLEVAPEPDYTLRLRFENEDDKIFDVKPYLNTGLFRQFRDEKIFSSVHISFDTIAWSNGVDLEPEELYAESKRPQTGG